MRPSCRIKLWGAIVAFAAICSTGFAQSPTSLPAGGDASMDPAAYEKAKIKFMQEHPDMFHQTTINARYEANKIASTATPETAQAMKMREFQSNKENWYNNDPARYQAALEELGLNQGQEVSVIPFEEYQTYSAEKKAVIDANPNLYRVSTPSTK